MTDVYDWPLALRPFSQVLRVPGQATEGGFTVGGARTLTPDVGGRAVLEWTFGYQSHPNSQRLFSWVLSKVGAGHVFRLPLATGGQLVQAADVGLSSGAFLNPIPWDDGALFDDGTGWAPEVGVFTVTTGTEGLTEVVCTMGSLDEGLGHGHVIGIRGRAYVVDDISYAGGGATITVTPPLRTNVASGEFVSFRPRMYGVCLDAEAFKAMFDLSGVIRPGTITFGEAIL